MKIASYKELIVWQKSMKLVSETYAVARQLPKYEMFGLANQIRRSAVSIPSNIAEGKKRKTCKDFLRFLRIAEGSAVELETQLLICESEHQLDCTKALVLLEEVQKMLNAMVMKMSASIRY